MKSLLSVLFVFILLNTTVFAHSTINEETNETSFTLNEEEIKTRLKHMPLEVVTPRYDNVVKSYLKTYFVRNRTKAADILGKSVLYFPIYEKVLAERGLPDDLKYLSVVESALNPKALSRAGAMGLWQFMPATGKEYGLRVDKRVDERSDTYKSTEAAAEYLDRQYKKFGDWALALAAYNSGSGRVSRAIKRARSKNFWVLQKYLPRETRNYVPAFIAAAYMMKYYDMHGMTPTYPELDAQFTRTIDVYAELNFRTIAEITGLPLDLIEFLNPSYMQGFIPESQSGHSLTLPQRSMGDMQLFLDMQRPDHNIMATTDLKLHPVYFTRPADYNEEEFYYHSIYTIREGETLAQAAWALNISTHQLKAWNNMKNDIVTPGQELVLFYPRQGQVIVSRPAPAPAKTAVPQKRETMAELPYISPVPITLLKAPKRDYKISKITKRATRKGKYVYYMIGQKETLLDIANKFPGVSVRDLMILNNFKSNQNPKKGENIKVKKTKR